MEISSSWQFSEGKLGAILRVTGVDAASFLQGQFTNELRELTVGAAVYGLWLNQKGKVLADSFVVVNSAREGFWVVSYSRRRPACDSAWRTISSRMMSSWRT